MLPELGTQKNGRGGNGIKEMYIIFIRNATFCGLPIIPNQDLAVQSFQKERCDGKGPARLPVL